VEFTEETNYPFDDVIHFTYKNKGKEIAFPFHLRIPGWCREAVVAVNGEKVQTAKGGQIIRIDRTWSDGDRLSLTLPMEVSLEKWHENSVSVQRGPLVYALKIGEKWEKITNGDKYGDYFEVHPLSEWNYGLMEVPQHEWQEAFRVVKRPGVSETPWNLEHAPIEIHAMAVALPEWKLYNGNAGPLPYSPQPMPAGSKPVPVTLIPYGCTTLRISEFPVVEK
jgi:hypothetical protein